MPKAKEQDLKYIIPADEEFYEKKNILVSSAFRLEDKVRIFAEAKDKTSGSDEIIEEAPVILIVEDNDDMQTVH